MTAPSTIPKARAENLLAGSPPALPPTDAAPDERRAHPRSEVFVNFTIQLVDEWGVVLQEELTVADNVSRSGARVMTTLSFQVGDVVLLQEAGGGFATRAQVRGRHARLAAHDRPPAPARARPPGPGPAAAAVGLRHRVRRTPSRWVL